MPSPTLSTTVAVIGGGVVGVAMLYTLAHRGVDTVLLEADSELALAASGTNSGILHTGFDSTPGSLETQLILRSAALRPAIFDALGIEVARLGAELVPRSAEDSETIQGLVANAAANGVFVEERESDGALLVPGESVTDPVAYSLALAAAATSAGAVVSLSSRVVAALPTSDQVVLTLEDGRTVQADIVINCAGLHADEIARLFGDDTFEIYPRKGEFFVFELPGGETLDHIILPAPTKRTKGVLVFPTLDGKVIAGPTAVDLDDKNDWSVRATAEDEILAKAVIEYPALAGLRPIYSYAGLRPAGRDSNYIIGQSAACDRLINVAAIRSTGLSASLGIAAYVLDLLPGLGVTLNAAIAPAPVAFAPTGLPWWQRTARHHL